MKKASLSHHHPSDVEKTFLICPYTIEHTVANVKGGPPATAAPTTDGQEGYGKHVMNSPAAGSIGAHARNLPEHTHSVSFNISERQL